MIQVIIRGKGGAPEKHVLDVDETDVGAVTNVIYNALNNHSIKCTIRDEFL